MTNIEADWAVAGSVKRRFVSLASVTAVSSDTGSSSAVAQPNNVGIKQKAPAVLQEPAATPRVTPPLRVTARHTVTPSMSNINENTCTHEPTASALGHDWFASEVSTPLDGPVPERAWNFQGPLNQHISERHAPKT